MCNSQKFACKPILWPNPDKEPVTHVQPPLTKTQLIPEFMVIGPFNIRYVQTFPPPMHIKMLMDCKLTGLDFILVPLYDEKGRLYHVYYQRESIITLIAHCGVDCVYIEKLLNKYQEQFKTLPLDEVVKDHNDTMPIVHCDDNVCVGKLPNKYREQFKTLLNEVIQNDEDTMLMEKLFNDGIDDTIIPCMLPIKNIEHRDNELNTLAALVRLARAYAADKNVEFLSA